MSVEKMSVSFDPVMAARIRQGAAATGSTVSGWLADAADSQLRRMALGDAVQQWQDEFGALTPDELAAADRVLDDADRRRVAAA